MSSLLETLPPELYPYILTYLSPEETVALAKTCRQMNRMIKNETIWQKHYLKRYTYFASTPQFSNEEYLPGSVLKANTPAIDCTWQELFRQRAFQDQQIRLTLNKIISNRLTRIQNATDISSNYGLLALDVLQKSFPPPNNQSLTSLSLPSRNLTREYYSLELTRLISRDIGLSLLNDLKLQQNLPTEGKALINALFIIQCFHPHGILLSLNRLRSIGKQLLNYSRFLNASINEKCQLILSTMRIEQFIPANGGSEYYDLENSFLFSTFNGKPTIPLTLVSIFCALADECGLKARPIGFPGEVMAQVEQSIENLDPLIISVFDSKIISLNEINERLADVLDEPLTYPLPVTSIKDLIIRSARNMINSITRSPTSTLYSYALYTVVAVFKILGVDALPFTFDSMMNILKEYFPMDTKFFQILSSTNVLNNHNLHLLQTEDSNSLGNGEKRRENASPIYYVGQIFQHKLFHYWGVMYGWDLRCAASPIWQAQMGVTSLARGATQPFYHIWADDRSRRYVAEDNIDTLAFTSMENESEKCSIIEKLCATDDIGKYFEQIDVINGKFLPSLELRQEYPDDFI